MAKASKTTKPSGLTMALLETADDMRKGGLLDNVAHEKITTRLTGEKAPPLARPIFVRTVSARR